jgi:hypothetical protein
MKTANETLIDYMLNQLTYLQGCFNILETEDTYRKKSVAHVKEFVKFTASELMKIKMDIAELKGAENDTLHN